MTLMYILVCHGMFVIRWYTSTIFQRQL